MNSLKIQFKALIFKNCILLSLFIFLVFPSVSAQSLGGTNDVKNLYDSALYYRNTNYNNAIEYFNQILLLKSKIPNDINPEYFKIYNWLGLIYKKQGNLQKAIEYYRYALNNTTDAYYKTLINDNIANVYSLRGDYTKAIYYFENSLAILEKSNKKRKYIDIVNNYHNQGFAYLNSGQMKLALGKSLKSIQIAEENKINISGIKYYNCGLAYQNLDSLNKADFYFKEAIKSYINEYGKSHYMTAVSYMNYAIFNAEIGKYLESEKLYKKSLQILINTLGNKHMRTARCFKNLGNLYAKKGNYKDALRYYQKSLVSKINNFNDSSIYANPGPGEFPDLDLLDVLKAKAQALEKLSALENKETNLKAALSTFELTVGFIEQLRMGYLYENSKLVLAEKEHETYMSIIEIAYQLLSITGNRDYINLAFKYSERSKYAILRESINEESARNFASIPENIQNQEQEIKEQIGNTRKQIENESRLENPDTLKQAELKERLFRLTQSREKIIGEFEQNYPEYYRRKYENKVAGVGGLQAALSEKEVFISYEFTGRKLFAFTVGKNQLELSCVPIDSLFHKSLKYYTEFLHSEYLLSYKTYRESAYELYRVLIEPLSPHLNGKNLLIAPNSQLSQVAFEALVTEPYRGKTYPDYQTVPYLIKRYPIGYAHSATLLVNSVNREKNYNPNFLGFAPDYKDYRDSLNYLPELPVNLEKISRLFRGKILVREEATEHALKKHVGNYGILHLYTYGYGDTLNPLNSKMFFSFKNDTVDDGYLYAYEIDRLNINTDLIVLASCYSGSGAIRKGEGTLSMGRSFMASGNPSIITSLWAAYVQPLLFEMNIFYKHLALGKRKDEALRLAKLKYLEETDNPTFTHPKYWASMVVIGNQQALFKGYILKIFALAAVVISILVAFSIFAVKKWNKRVKL